MDIDEFLGLYNSNQAARHAMSQADIVIFLRLTEQQIIALKKIFRKTDQVQGGNVTNLTVRH